MGSSAAKHGRCATPELVARRVLVLIEQSNPPPRVTVGGIFQAKVAR